MNDIFVRVLDKNLKTDPKKKIYSAYLFKDYMKWQMGIGYLI